VLIVGKPRHSSLKGERPLLVDLGMVSLALFGALLLVAFVMLCLFIGTVAEWFAWTLLKVVDLVERWYEGQ
jgi:hypothetical protein